MSQRGEKNEALDGKMDDRLKTILSSVVRVESTTKKGIRKRGEITTG